MGFLSWLTGRDPKEADVYANFERVDELVTNLKKVATENVAQANDAVRAAVIELNQVKGMEQYVGQLEPDCFTPTFEKVATAIDQLGTMTRQKADNIKEYEEASVFEKIGSSIFMGVAKVGEGILSVVEDVGDGVVSLVGWVAPKDSGVEKWCSDFVQKEWSHDVFNFYYESDFAKASVFTEDSALAGACKIGGKVVAYMYGGGLLSGAGSATVGTVAGHTGRVASTASRVFTGMRGLASSSTWGATLLAGAAGMGSGTEEALINGAESFDAAAWSGAKKGALEAGIAFAGGKLGERAKWAANGRTGKWSQFEGYDDALSRAGRDAGRAGMQNIFNNGLVNGTVMNTRAVLSTAANGGRQLITNAASGGRNLVTNAANIVRHPIQSAGTAIRAIPNVVRAAPGAAMNAVRTTAQFAMANPGVVAQGVNAVITNADASANLGYGAAGVDILDPTLPDITDGYTQPTEVVIPQEEQYRINTDNTPLPGDPSDPSGPSNPSNPSNPYVPGDQTPTDPSTPEIPGTGITPPGTTTPTDPSNPGTPVNPGDGGGYVGPTDGGTGDGTHSGGGFGDDEFSGKPFEIDDEFGLDDGEDLDSIGDIIASGDNLTKIPESTKPIKSESSGASAVIPIAAGLSAAAAAGIGAKVFMDKKNNSDNGEDDEFETDDWSDESQIEIDYEDSEGSIADQYLNDEDDYGYHASSEEKYGARSNEELAELQ